MLMALGKKALLLIAFLLALSMLVFFLASLSPGDPLFAYYGEGAERMSEAQREAAMSRLSLDKPAAVRYIAWLKNALTGELGISHRYKQDVSGLILTLLPNTLLLGGSAYILTFILAILLGVFCAAKESSLPDRTICRAGTAVSVIPGFSLGLLGILLFGVKLRLLPTGGAYSLGGGGFFDRAAHLVLPVSVMIISHLWYYAAIIRNRVLEELNKDYVLLLRVKRLSEARILLRHCLRNALPMLISLMAVSLPHIIAGTYIIENVFGYPGIGTLVFESARYRDYNTLAALTLLTGTVVLIGNISGQALSELLDRRMCHDGIIPGGGDE